MLLKKNLMKIVVASAALALFAGCGSPDVEKMQSGLIRSGMDADQAACLAEKMSDTVDKDPYNYMAALLSEGATESNAVNKTRRKFGGDFKTGLKAAKAACAE